MILPLVAELLARVGRHPALESALEALHAGAAEAHLAGLTDPAKALVAAETAQALGRTVVLLVDSNQRAESFVEPVRFFSRVLAGKPASEIALLPAPDVLPYQGLSPHPEISLARAIALWRLAAGSVSVLIVPVTSALIRLRDSEFYHSLARVIARDDEIPLDELVEHLSSVGYERQEMVEMPGQFAVRGGILDVFSPESPRPLRIELFGDSVVSVREFDPETQRSTSPVERATLLPLTEFLRPAARLTRAGAAGPGEEELDRLVLTPSWGFELSHDCPVESLFELAGDCVVLLDEPASLDDAMEKFLRQLSETYARARKELDAAEPSCYYRDASQWRAALASRPRLVIERLAMAGAEPIPTLAAQPTLRYHGNVAVFMAEVRGRITAGEQVIVSAASTGELERLADLCHDYELPYRLAELEEDVTITRLSEEASAGSVPAVVLAKTPLAEGVALPELRLVLYGNADLFETLTVPARPRARAKAAAFASDFSDLQPGALVVHVDHGIAEFEGLRRLPEGEFMLLRYADDARLYLPLARLDLVQKYRALGGARPPLDKLGGTTWAARKARVRRSVDDMAEKLLKLYADRKAGAGHAFPPDTPWQKEFEDAFEFEETADQARAIGEVKSDLKSPQSMDRLLCGDVGYGKTEVAMRAAFKVVSDSKQVAVLAPTTVLVFQHYQTFRRRFAAFPLRIEMLSRFRSRREQKQVLADLEAGKVDIVIGTHRLLSRDVRFHDLGLLIVDEEQRFGVAHKERLKEMSHGVDVLAMSATPIPRTLHMSLVGLRDMSVIETPPKGRLAIQTVVAPFEERLVQRAIEEELARGGQVYFLHNRIESIFSMAALLRRLVPRARIVVGHGQMDEKQLEEVMLKFVSGEADLLLSTSIIENGLDIPRTNTIVINRADRFGLAELYQLRGRVGRSNQRAYAYLLVPRQAALSGTARQRLAALKEFSELGAGFRIAALDLELRGAGNLLGREQHGHINAIGFDLYCQMLERAVAERKGEPARHELRTTLNLGLDIRIPPDYIPNENTRLRTYKRIAGITSEAERDEVLAELKDLFGPPPPAILNLLDYAVLKGLCEKLLVAAVERRDSSIAVKFHPETPVRPERLVRVIRARKGMRLDPAGVLWIDWRRGASPAPEAVRNVLLQLQA